MKRIFKVKGMHCSSCAMLIEGALEDAGVFAKCSYAKQEVEVEFDPEKINESGIVKVIKGAGYSLEN